MSTHGTHADHRAAYAQEWDSASPSEDEWPEVAILPTHRAARDGWTVLGTRGGRGHVVLPALLPSAPPSVQQRYYARAMATLAGRCPLCDAVAGLSADPQRSPAAWHKAPLTVDLPHAEDCPTVFTEADRKYFHPDAVGRNSGPDDA